MIIFKMYRYYRYGFVFFLLQFSEVWTKNKRYVIPSESYYGRNYDEAQKFCEGQVPNGRLATVKSKKDWKELHSTIYFGACKFRFFW